MHQQIETAAPVSFPVAMPSVTSEPNQDTIEREVRTSISEAIKNKDYRVALANFNESGPLDWIIIAGYLSGLSAQFPSSGETSYVLATELRDVMIKQLHRLVTTQNILSPQASQVMPLSAPQSSSYAVVSERMNDTSAGKRRAVASKPSLPAVGAAKSVSFSRLKKGGTKKRSLTSQENALLVQANEIFNQGFDEWEKAKNKELQFQERRAAYENAIKYYKEYAIKCRELAADAFVEVMKKDRSGFQIRKNEIIDPETCFSLLDRLVTKQIELITKEMELLAASSQVQKLSCTP